MSKEDKREGIPSVSDRRRTDQDPERKPKSKKDTKRWCKGKVGREHVGEIVYNPMWGNPVCGVSTWMKHSKRWSCHHMDACKNCGKRLRWSITLEECPTYQERGK
jgi:hypothetical protein